MQVILASAKIMKERVPSRGITPTEPLFQRQATMLAAELAHMSGNRLSELFNCSAAIGRENRERFALFGTDMAEIMPAILTYYGQAYKHLKAESLTNEDLEWANSHLWISSCLYGLLRPLNGIQTYRMEGGFPMQATGGLKVNEFWRPLLTNLLIESVKADDGILIYLDTEEFRSLFNWKRVVEEVQVIEPKFQVLKNGRLTTQAVWAKSCRGAMARYIIEERITNPLQLANFNHCGFSLSDSPENSSTLHALSLGHELSLGQAPNKEHPQQLAPQVLPARSAEQSTNKEHPQQLAPQVLHLHFVAENPQ